ncbi:MAG TPA: alpha/beta hydrolase [Lapillicoccus sp.]|jgi:pimeloyl-ACP methyl ester carboxylesterase|nr:alpha/beta hydrolase [Lapillicoccus sp.]
MTAAPSASPSNRSRSRVALLATATALALGAAACTTTTPTDTTTTAGATAGARAFAYVTCPKPNIPGIPQFDFPANMRCGYLAVPENRGAAGGRTIRIFVMRVPAVSANPQPDPIVVLSGGPGGGGSFEFASRIKAGMNAERELILVDQRGTHLADPLLGCAEYDESLNRGFIIGFTTAAAATADVAATKACRDRHAATGVDLSAYNTKENAADIADLRVALGIQSWNVYGVSYGTKLALVSLRDHPQGIRTLVLDSVSPPNLNIVKDWWSAPAESFKAIFAACRAQPACAAAFPTLEADFFATVTRLDASPVVVATKDASGAPVTLTIDAFAFAFTVIDGSEHGDPSTIPKMIADMARGNSDLVVKAMLGELVPPPIVGLGGLGLAFTVFCAEGANLTTEQEAGAKSKAVLPQFPDRVFTLQPKQGRLFQQCPVWDVKDADASMSTPVVSEIPVLILEGTFDAATAPSWVDLITPGLKANQLVSMPFTGHSVYGKSPCSVQITAAFLNSPTRPVDKTCAEKFTRPFVTS